MRMKRKLKSFIYSILNIVSIFLPRQRAAILLYHDVGTSDLYLSVSAENFERQMEYLKTAGYKVVSLKMLYEMLLAMQDINPKTVVLTFDDGYLSHHRTVLPILEKYGFHGTFFVATDSVGKNIDNSEHKPRAVLDWDGVRALDASPMADVEPHSRSHRELPTLARDDVQKEISGSRQLIEDWLNKKCTTFAYPRGAHDAEAVEVVRAEGFPAAVTVDEGLVEKGTDPLLLPRNTINKDTTMVEFKGKLTHSARLFSLLNSAL